MAAVDTASPSMISHMMSEKNHRKPASGFHTAFLHLSARHVRSVM